MGIMATCARCGASLEGGARFCGKCGAQIQSGTDPPLLTEASASFDLTRDLPVRRDRDVRQRKSFMRAGLGLIILGGVFILLSLWVPGKQDATALLGVLFVVVGGPMMMFIAYGVDRQSESNLAAKLELSSLGFRVTRPNGVADAIRWDDPSLEIDVCQLIDSDRGFLPANDARRTTPEWFTAYFRPGAFGYVWGTIPSDAVHSIIQTAESKGVTLRVKHVGFYWLTGPKGLSQLSWENEGALQRAKSLNGRLIQLRGSMWKDSPTGYASSYWEWKRLRRSAGMDTNS